MNPNVAELASLAGYALVKRWNYDWSSLEAQLGFRFPSEYKEYVSYFPPVLHGGVIIAEHPAVRDGGMTFPERIRFFCDYLRDWKYRDRPSMPFYPDPGGLIPWAAYESTAALCWLPEWDDPDKWPVYAASDTNKYEHLPGSTLEALMAVLRKEAGRSVFEVAFYHSLDLHGDDPFSLDIDESSSPDVDLPEPEPLDPPADQ